ncbi:hypothetical protein PRIPAC_76886, partial [Pristionchus pacificus]
VNFANRQEKELTLLRQNCEARLLPHPTTEVYTCTVDLVIQTMNFTIDETWKFFHKIDPSLGDLPLHEQMELYRCYLPKFTMIDSYLRTWSVWGVYDKFSMCSVCVCVDLDHPESWLKPGDGGRNRQTVVDSMIPYVRHQMSVLVPSLQKAKITEREGHALFALMLCETDVERDVSERLFTILDAIRAETLQDLQRYYRAEMGLSDFSIRLGNLLTICHNVRECTSHFLTFFRMNLTLFDLWSTEEQLKLLI